MDDECWHIRAYGTCENCEVKDLEPEVCPKKNGYIERGMNINEGIGDADKP